MKFPKLRPVRSEAYRRFVASFPCFSCGVEGFSQAAHPNTGKGLGIKTSDLDCFPLCAPHWGMVGCHQMHDLLLDMTRDDRRAAEDRYIARMHQLAREHGRKEFLEAA